MDLLRDDIKKIYFKYLAASFGGALISSIYGLVDMAMVGQYHGPIGSAAMAVIAPIWNILYSLGLLTGIGGSVIFSMQRGKNKGSQKENEYFTVAVVGTAILAMAMWVILALFDDKLLVLFGADESLLKLAKQYLLPVKLTAPIFLFTQLISAFLRNDSSPALTTKAILAGGVFNILGDYLLIFVFDMGILGAGIATAGGASLSLLVMLTHFFSKRNTLRLVRPAHFLRKLRRIVVAGFSTFFIDIAMGILTMLFNRQIMKYSGQDALAVYGIIVNISTFVQCCAYAVGQAAQPLLSTNYGAGRYDRIKKMLRYNLVTVAIVSLAWIALTMTMPNGFVRLFMSPTDSVLELAPMIIRCYSTSFLLLPLNIYSTYYFQSILKQGVSFIVSVSRGMILSGTLIIILPLLFGGNSLWLAMPMTELAVAAYVLWMILSFSHKMN